MFDEYYNTRITLLSDDKRVFLYLEKIMNKYVVKNSVAVHSDKNQHLGVCIDHLIALTNQKSYRMPSGLTREERRAWAKNNQKIQN